MDTDHRFYLSTLSPERLEDLLSLASNFKERAPKLCEWLRYGCAREIVSREQRPRGHEVVPGVLDAVNDWRGWSDEDIALGNALLCAWSYGVGNQNPAVDWLVYVMASEVKHRLLKGAKREPAS